MSRRAGMTLIEVLVVLAIAALLLGALGGVVGQSFQAWAATRERNELSREARFAMERMLAAVGATRLLMVPMPEDPFTAHSESVRAVLAVGLDPGLDRDGDGFADGDNDKDGRVDEDPSDDITEDGESGIIGIDDDGDGTVDEDDQKDDDEDGADNEDGVDGTDDDLDGKTDEDPKHDINGDGLPGVAGVDDDGDGDVDEGDKNDDDEDGLVNEDWIDPVVFFLNGSTLLERLPDLDAKDGKDFTEYPIAENVSLFRVERLAPGPGDRAVLVDITLELSVASGETVSLSSRVRVGDGL